MAVKLILPPKVALGGTSEIPAPPITVQRSAYSSSSGSERE